MSQNKKMRGMNFTRNEKAIIVGLIKKYRNVIQNKRTDAATIASKNEVWQKLTTEFNSKSSHCHRTTEQLKTCWENMKRLTRKDNDLVKKEIFLTGRDPSKILPVDTLSGRVVELLGPTSEGIPSKFSNNFIYNLHAAEERIVDNLEEKVTSEETCPSTSWATWHQTELRESPVENPTSIKVEQDSLDEQDSLPSILCPTQFPTIVHQSLTKTVPIDVESQIIRNPILINGHNNETPLQDNITKPNRNRNWRQRRKPKSLDDQFLQSKIDLIRILREQAEGEAKQKKLILMEQLEQEKIKTQLLQLELQRKNM